MRRHALLLAVALLLGTPGVLEAEEFTPPVNLRDSNAARVAVDAADEALKAGDLRRGLAELQRVLDRLRDDLVVVEEKPELMRWITAPEAARRRLEALSPAGRRTYEDMVLPTAKALLERAVVERDEVRLREVVDRFGASSAGVAAARLLAESAFEAGRPRDAAVALRDGLRFAPQDAGLWLRLVDALAAAGDVAALDRLSPPAGAGPVPDGGGIDPVLASRLGEARRALEPLREAAKADAERAAHVDRAPFDHRVRPLRWSAGSPPPWRRNDDTPGFLSVDDSPRRLLLRWRILTPCVPARAGRRLFLSDGFGVEARDLVSGRTEWTFPSPERPTPGLDVPARSGETLPGRTNLDVTHEPVLAGGLVLAHVEVRAPYVQRQLQGIEITTYRQRRALVALDAATGALRWRMGASKEDAAALAGLSVATNPVAADGVVSVLGVTFDQRWRVFLLAFDVPTGALRWKRELLSGQQELNLFGYNVKELWAGTPAIADGTVYAPTGLGVLAAVDLRTGELRWATSYDQIPIERVEYWYTTPLRFGTWAAGPVRVHGDVVLATPPESPFLLCLDRKDGRLRWREPSQATRTSPYVDHLLGVARDGKRDVVLATGRSLRAYDLATGNPVWRAMISTDAALVRGRGTVSEGTVYVPTEQGLARFSLASEGKFQGEDPWPQGTQSGNVLLCPEVLVVAGGANPGDESRNRPVQAFYDWEDLERALAARRAASPNDPATVLDEADLWRVVGDDRRAGPLYEEAARLATVRKDAALLERTRQGLRLLALDRGDAARSDERTSDARTAYEAALARSEGARERVEVRLRLDVLLSAKGLEGARVRNLKELVEEAGEGRATFDPEEGEVPVRAAARFRLSALYRASGRAADAVDVLQDALREDREAAFGLETAGQRVPRLIAEILAVEGPLPYRRHERAAAERLAKAAADDDPAPFEAVLLEYPNATTVPEALFGLAERQARSGAHAAAARTLRRFLSAYPEHADAPRALATLARALAGGRAVGPARAALLTLERRHADARFTMDGAPTTGREFATAERARLGTAAPRPPERTLAPPLTERVLEPLDVPTPGSVHVVDVAGIATSVVPVPILVDDGAGLVCLDPAAGTVRWRASWASVDRVTMAGDVLVVARGDELLAVEPDTGEVRWKLDLHGVASALDAGMGQVLVVVREPGRFTSARFLALDPLTSDVLWQRELNGDPVDGLVVGEEGAALVRRKATPRGFGQSVAIHSLLTGELVRDLPTSGDGWIEPPPRLGDGRTLLTAGRSGRVVRIEAHDLSTGKTRWSRPLDGTTTQRLTHVLVRGDDVVVLDEAGRLTTLSLASGEVRATTAVTGGLALLPPSAPALDDANVYVLVRESRGSVLTAFDRTTGRAAWVSPFSTPVNAGLLFQSGDTLVVVQSPRPVRGGSAPVFRTLLVSAKTGAEIARIDATGLTGYLPSATIRDGALVLAGDKAFGLWR